ncbi:MAG: hypothetical protein ABFC24_08325 [Methanoregulaceae archaeon]
MQPTGYRYSQLLREICLARPFTYLAVILLSISGMLFAIVTPLIMRALIDDVLIGKNTVLLTPLLAAMARIFLVSALSYLSTWVKEGSDSNPGPATIGVTALPARWKVPGKSGLQALADIQTSVLVIRRY